MFATFFDDGGLEYRLDVENSIYLRFDAAHRCFNVTSKDGERLLTLQIETELQKRDWKYYEDGHGGMHAWITAPEEDRSELEGILMSR